MKFLYLLFLLISAGTGAFASPDAVMVPLQRRYFHDKIDKQQKLCEKADGKADNYFHVSSNEEVNLRLTDVLFRKVDALQDWVESNDQISNNNEKIHYLGYIENVLRDFRIALEKKDLSPLDFPLLIENFEAIIKIQVEGKSMAQLIDAVPYKIASINTEIFFDNIGYKDSKSILYKKL